MAFCIARQARDIAMPRQFNARLAKGLRLHACGLQLRQQALRARGAQGMVSLTSCSATPSSHIGCVPPFLNFMLGKLKAVAQDL